MVHPGCAAHGAVFSKFGHCLSFELWIAISGRFSRRFLFRGGGLFFGVAALCAVVLVLEVLFLFFERPVPRLLTPPSRRSEPKSGP
jgi:hypothetical protein